MSQSKPPQLQEYPSGGVRYSSHSNLHAAQDDGSQEKHSSQGHGGARAKEPRTGYPSSDRSTNGYPPPKTGRMDYPVRDTRGGYPQSSSSSSVTGHAKGTGDMKNPTSDNRGRHEQGGQAQYGAPQKYANAGTPQATSGVGYPSRSSDKYPNDDRYKSASRSDLRGEGYSNLAYAPSREDLARPQSSAAVNYQPTTNSQGQPVPVPPSRRRGAAKPEEPHPQPQQHQQPQHQQPQHQQPQHQQPQQKQRQQPRMSSSSSAPYSPPPATPTSPATPQGPYPQARAVHHTQRDTARPAHAHPQQQKGQQQQQQQQPSKAPGGGVKYMSTSDLTQAISSAPLDTGHKAAPVGHAQSLSTLNLDPGSYPAVSSQPVSTHPEAKTVPSAQSPKSESEEESTLAGLKRKFRFQKNKNAPQSRPTSTHSAAHLAQNTQMQRYGSKISLNTSGGATNTLNAASSQQGSQWSLNTISGAYVNMEPNGMKRSASMYSVASIKSVNIPRCGSFISLTTATGETKIMAADTFESCFNPALVTTIICFFPIGIVAILYAKQAKKAYEEGDLIEGRRKAETARTLVIVTVCVGMLCWILGIIALVLVVMT